MKCKRVYRRICDSLDEDLDSPNCREIKRHLDNCPECSAYLASLKETVDLYRTLPVPHITAGAHRRLFKVIKTMRATAGGRRSARRSALH